jgi:hypothetical protein
MPTKKPTNRPTLICAECQTSLTPQIVTAANNDGEVFVVSVDEWPTYYIDTLDWRTEFCGPKCVMQWQKNKSHTV